MNKDNAHNRRLGFLDVMTHNSAEFWLRALGFLTVVIAAIGFYLQWSSPIEQEDTAGLSQSIIYTYQIFRIVSHTTLLLFVISGLLLLGLRPIASYVFFITSMTSLFVFSLPIVLLLIPAILRSTELLNFKLIEISGYASQGHLLFGVIFFQFWAPSLVFKCFRSLSTPEAPNETDENDKAFNNAIESDRE